MIKDSLPKSIFTFFYSFLGFGDIKFLSVEDNGTFPLQQMLRVNFLAFNYKNKIKC